MTVRTATNTWPINSIDFTRVCMCMLTSSSLSVASWASGSVVAAATPVLRLVVRVDIRVDVKVDEDKDEDGDEDKERAGMWMGGKLQAKNN